ncbi:MAG: histidinol-phosphate aminotransferase family protein [Peptostreptococcaceae bacterium]|nr:histidinol-phosphate aminotransferase family protein [Peptostreptococcaceae bacterium]
MYHIRKHLEKIKHESYANVPEDFAADGIDCSLGINPYGFPKAINEAARMMNLDLISQYPHGDSKLKNAIMDYWKDCASIDMGQIELACGSMDSLTKINKMFIDKGTAVIGHGPQFPDFGMDVEAMGGIYETVDMFGNNGRFNGQRLINAIESRHAICYIDNPNNPTGQIIPIETISKIVEKAAKLGVCVLVDEAYGDFMEKKNSAINLMERYDNIMVVKSFSKGFGMAGMRVGYAVGPVELMDVYRKVAIPFCVSGMGAVFAQEALKEEGFLEESREKIAVAKKKVIESMKTIGVLETSLTVPIMTMVHEDKKVDLYSELLKVQVLSVPGCNFEGLGKNCVRLRINADVDVLVERIEQLEKK